MTELIDWSLVLCGVVAGLYVSYYGLGNSSRLGFVGLLLFLGGAVIATASIAIKLNQVVHDASCQGLPLACGPEYAK